MAADNILALSLVEEYVSGLQDSKAEDTAAGKLILATFALIFTENLVAIKCQWGCWAPAWRMRMVFNLLANLAPRHILSSVTTAAYKNTLVAALIGLFYQVSKSLTFYWTVIGRFKSLDASLVTFDRIHLLAAAIVSKWNEPVNDLFTFELLVVDLCNLFLSLLSVCVSIIILHSPIMSLFRCQRWTVYNTAASASTGVR